MIVLIPAYRHDDRLLALIEGLRSARRHLAIVVVDDGSGPDFAEVFDRAGQAGAEVVHHGENCGKGAALRTGFVYARTHHRAMGVVTADADGQHRVGDILRVARALEETGNLVPGVREFSGQVPLRSQVGNDVTAILFRLSTGWNLADTRTGLRGHPVHLLEWLGTTPGERYEYELTVLLGAARAHLDHEEVPVETVYEAGNTSSHFPSGAGLTADLRPAARLLRRLLGLLRRGPRRTPRPAAPLHGTAGAGRPGPGAFRQRQPRPQPAGVACPPRRHRPFGPAPHGAGTRHAHCLLGSPEVG
ncbi:MAG: glycosyltransferase family 2 protein [Propionibacterium sp.]|nr:glycosyltransferase family 2 protein [Propionibacterium sp.]